MITINKRSVKTLARVLKARARILVVVAAFFIMAFGAVLLNRSQAATMVTHTEAESGVLTSGAEACADSQASAGRTVRFSYTGCNTAWPKYTNPVFPVEPGGNIVYYNGYYYTPVKLGPEPRVRMMRAKWLSDFKVIDSDAARTAQKVVWDGAGTPASAAINWPVAMYRLQGKWYIYLEGASKNPADFTDRLYVLQADTDDPMGTWTFKGRVGNDTWTIGYCPFEFNGKLYMIIANREDHTSGTHHALAIAEMTNPWTVNNDWTTLTDPDYDWETWSADGPDTAPINEVDQAIIHNGKLHVFYSASHVNTQHYAAGLLTYDGSGSLLDRDNWTKQSQPVLSRTSLTAGPGQTFVFKSPDGKTDYLGYAYWHTPTELSPRPIAVEPIKWDANGYPIVNPPPDPGSQFDEPMKP